MANTLSVAGATRVAWSLSDGVGSSKSDTQSSSRSITTGTGPNQANVAFSETISTQATGIWQSYDDLAFAVSAFGVNGSARFTKIKEVFVSVATGPTGGYMVFSMPTGVANVRINAGGQFHYCDYLTGIPVSAGMITVSNGVSGAYSGEITVIGEGSFEAVP
jgi:hypothetical protein